MVVADRQPRRNTVVEAAEVLGIPGGAGPAPRSGYPRGRHAFSCNSLCVESHRYAVWWIMNINICWIQNLLTFQLHRSRNIGIVGLSRAKEA